MFWSLYAKRREGENHGRFFSFVLWHLAFPPFPLSTPLFLPLIFFVLFPSLHILRLVPTLITNTHLPTQNLRSEQSNKYVLTYQYHRIASTCPQFAHRGTHSLCSNSRTGPDFGRGWEIGGSWFWLAYVQVEKVCVWIKRCTWIIISPRVGRLILLSRVILGLTGMFHGCFVYRHVRAGNFCRIYCMLMMNVKRKRVFAKGKPRSGRGGGKKKMLVFHKLESTI